MERYDLFRDLAERTGGDIYFGVVGAMRTGKSTFIKRFMDLLVLPSIADPVLRERTKDELPQSGAGRTVMTTEPKFVPERAVHLTVGDSLHLRVRLVDCVGFSIPGARGIEEEEGYPRMVRTPWHEQEIPFEEAAEFGTRKVMQEHATLGVVVTTDGSITDIPRENYLEAEERVIRELKELGKPFVVLLNSRHPRRDETMELAERLSHRYDVPVVPCNLLDIDQQELLDILERALYEFPVREVRLHLSRWVDHLQQDNWLRQKAQEEVWQEIAKVERVRDLRSVVHALEELDWVETAQLRGVDLGTGQADILINVKQELFYQVVSDLTGLAISGDHQLVSVLQELAAAKKRFDKVAQALEELQATGYGVAMPTREDIEFEPPELFRQGGRFGVRLRARASSIHLIRTEIEAEVTPFVGTEKQGEEMLRYLTEEMENDPARIWESTFLGKPLEDLVEDSLRTKILQMPEDARVKLQETISRIVNEGSGGLICIIL
ncbi:MAG: stage IV sporulation protein A [Firmicutes bacterium]|nr:stage IV sporulation protein A [Bacillota bacterium]